MRPPKAKALTSQRSPKRTDQPLMKNWQEAPAFGDRIELERYTVRPSAYCIVENNRGQIAVVCSSQGVFLPGGGVERDETPIQAVVREALEECGLVVRVGHWAIRAVQFVYSESEQTHFEKRSIFVDAVVESVTPSGMEADHKLVWASPETTLQMLSHASQRWAVGQWQTRTSVKC